MGSGEEGRRGRRTVPEIFSLISMVSRHDGSDSRKAPAASPVLSATDGIWPAARRRAPPGHPEPRVEVQANLGL